MSIIPNVFSSAQEKLSFLNPLLKPDEAVRLSPPITVEIHPSERCNHKCPLCQARYAMPVKEARSLAQNGIDLDFSLLESIWKTPPQGVIVSGNTGDPLMHPNITTLLDTLHQQSIPAVLITNGEALTQDMADVIVRTTRGVRISLDAHDPRTFHKTHGRTESGWEQVLTAIGWIMKARQSANLTKLDCLIGLGYLTDQRTQKGMFPATQLARNLGVDYIQFRPYHYQVSDISTELELCQSMETDVFSVLASEQKYGRLNNISRSYSRCHGANLYTVVDARADVYICCHHIGNPDGLIGSLRSKNWSDIVYSTERLQILEGFDVSSCLPLCRLHAHNELLEHNNTSGMALGEKINPLIKAHAAFL